MDKAAKIELIQRTLGLRHKLKVHETLDVPQTHEDMALMLSSKWDLEDELIAIEEILEQLRYENKQAQKQRYLESHSLKSTSNTKKTKKQ